MCSSKEKNIFAQMRQVFQMWELGVATKAPLSPPGLSDMTQAERRRWCFVVTGVPALCWDATTATVREQICVFTLVIYIERLTTPHLFVSGRRYPLFCGWTVCAILHVGEPLPLFVALLKKKNIVICLLWRCCLTVWHKQCNMQMHYSLSQALTLPKLCTHDNQWK